MPYVEPISGRRWEDVTLQNACAGEPVRYPVDELNLKMKRFPDPTIKAMAHHYSRIANADLAFPIILFEGTIVDGAHRVVKALAEGIKYVNAYILKEMPPADGLVSSRWERVG